MTLSLTNKIVNIVTDANMIKDDTHSLKIDKIDTTEMNHIAEKFVNRATETFEERIEGVIELVEASKEHVASTKQEESDIKSNNHSHEEANDVKSNKNSHPLPSASRPSHAPVKVTISPDKHNLSLVQSLNAKETSAQLATTSM